MFFLVKLTTSLFAALLLVLSLFLGCVYAEETTMNKTLRGNFSSVEASELWTGELYTSRFRVGLCFSATGKVRGALFLRRADGQIDEYHFNGTVHNNHIEAHHSSGHTFAGRLVSHDRVEGRISLKNGMKIFLEGKRHQDAPLNLDDCSPLPESDK